jgi:hypothetical protein
LPAGAGRKSPPSVPLALGLTIVPIVLSLS